MERQAPTIQERKRRCRPQDGSYRKKPPLGIIVEIFAMRGTWSEVARVMEVKAEEGKRSFQAWLIKTLSRRTSVGLDRMFDQVNWRSLRGSSIRPRLLIVSLKSSASETEKLVLFLSAGLRVRLKPPAMI